MIVVAIVGILAAIAIPKFADLVRQANEGATKGNLGAVRSAIVIYYASQQGMYPNPAISGYQSNAGSLGDVLTTNNGKYLSVMPNCVYPPYHPQATNYTALLSSSLEMGTQPQAIWGYQTGQGGPGLMSQGDFWACCTHTDTKGTVWGSY